MISGDKEFQKSLQQLERMYRALATLRAEVVPQSAANFQLLAEGPIDEINRLRREIDEYLGIAQHTTAASV